MSARKGHEVIPSARRLIHSLRDMGYEFAPAIADLMDNSLEAGASQVDVWIEFRGDESWVRIADNGSGMTGAFLREAMRYGSDRDYAENDLSKFGLGMKTASMSQCRRLTVASRVKGNGSVAAYSWDLDHIAETDRWEILPVKKTELPASISVALGEGHNTVILWEQLDRILGFRHPYGESQRKQLAQMTREVEDHLAMVFHRFLSGEARRRRIKIRLNGNQIAPWDPFCRGEKRLRKLEGRSIPVEHNDVSGEVAFDPFVLPHQNRFSSLDAHERAGGPRKWNRQQGFYIYRADRLIQSGGWSGLRVQDEHTKLARIALSFGPKLDEAFKINVAKMRVQLPVQMRQELERLLTPVLRAANVEYRRGGANSSEYHQTPTPHTASTPKAAPEAPKSPSPITPTDRDSEPTTANDPPTQFAPPLMQLFTRSEVLAEALAVAMPAEQLVLRAVFARLENFPTTP